jgi:hypothetical protein
MQQIEDAVILSSAYLPNLHYLSKLLLHKNAIIDCHETYQKQSYRNRCSIFSESGELSLTIPVIKPFGNRTSTKDVLIEYETSWQQVHWRAIVSAYGHSSFFEIFEPEFVHLFEKKEKYLVDFNEKILLQIQLSLGISFTIAYSKEYLPKEKYRYDFRDSIHPKSRMQLPDSNYKAIEYFQVFSQNLGHLPNLSFIDLMFNEGPQAIDICRKCCVS